MNPKTRPDLAALGLCALIVVACTVLAALRQPIPDFLPLLGLTVAGIGGGAALNLNGSRPEDLRPEPGRAAAPAADLPAAPLPAPRAELFDQYADPAQTGVFARVVSHD